MGNDAGWGRSKGTQQDDMIEQGEKKEKRKKHLVRHEPIHLRSGDPARRHGHAVGRRATVGWRWRAITAVTDRRRRRLQEIGLELREWRWRGTSTAASTTAAAAARERERGSSDAADIYRMSDVDIVGLN